MLNEPEAKAVLAAYGIPVPQTMIATSPKETEAIAGLLLAGAPKLVVKLISKSITHKSDVGGVVLDILSPVAAREAAEAIAARLKAHDPTAVVDGFAVQPMIEPRNAWELILGISRDPIFGPVVLFGSGGVSVEVVADTAVALPPLDAVLAGDLIDETRVGKLLAGFRNEPPADRAAICKALTALSQLIVDFRPCFQWISTRWSPAPRASSRSTCASKSTRGRSRVLAPIAILRSAHIRVSGKSRSRSLSGATICGRSDRQTRRFIRIF
ncbi:hypothetical protein T190_30085 [Sinorhizobium meliloti CCBAU 01290]|nr:hypothetical protein T190_30085 [Sinorhizobium meliloti CCBAU 01290]